MKYLVNEVGYVEAEPDEELPALLTIGLGAINGEESDLWETFFILLGYDPINDKVPFMEVREFRTEVMALKKIKNLDPAVRRNLEIISILFCYKGIIPGYDEQELWGLFKTVEKDINEMPLLLFLAAQLAVDSYNNKPGPQTEAVAKQHFQRLLSWFSGSMRFETTLAVDTPAQSLTHCKPSELNAEMMALYAVRQNFENVPRLLCELSAYENNRGVQYQAFVQHALTPYENPPQTAVNLPLSEPDIFLRIHWEHAASQEVLTLEQRIALRQKYWPDQAITEGQLELDEVSQMILAKFLIEDAAAQLNSVNCLTQSLVNEVCDVADAQVKHVVALKCEGAEALQYDMDYFLARAVLARPTAEGPKFSLGCALLSKYPSNPVLQCNLANYLIREDIAEAFPGEDKVQLIVTLLRLPEAAFSRQAHSRLFQNFIRSEVQPFIEREGCTHKVQLAASSEDSEMRLTMDGLDEAAMLALRKRFEAYVTYRAHKVLAEERATLIELPDNPGSRQESRVLSAEDYNQKALLIEAVHQSCTDTNDYKKARTTLGGFFNKAYYSKIDENSARLLNLARACDSADEDRSMSAERVIEFLRDKKTLLDYNSPAFCLMKNMSTVIGFNFEKQCIVFRHSPTDLREAFCANLEVFFLAETSSYEIDPYTESKTL